MPLITASPFKLAAWDGDVSGATYSGVSFNINEEPDPSGLQFKPDGTKMYVVGFSNDAVFQYTLSTPWDMSTASYDSVSSSVNSEDFLARGIFFKPDGTKMYMCGDISNDTFQYTLSTPWDISTLSYDSVSTTVTENPRGIFFKPDGTRMWEAGISNTNPFPATIYEYDLSVAWDLSTAAVSTVSLNINAQDSGPTDVHFKADGTKMYVMGATNDAVYQYTLSTPWDLSTASYDSLTLDVSPQTTDNPSGVAISSDETKLYVLDRSPTQDKVFEYNL